MRGGADIREAARKREAVATGTVTVIETEVGAEVEALAGPTSIALRRAGRGGPTVCLMNWNGTCVETDIAARPRA